MRLGKVLVIILTGLVTQSCKIEMPSLVELLKDWKPYNVSKSQALKAQSGFKDTLIVGDDRETAHGKSMFQNITEQGVEETSLVFFLEFGRAGLTGNIGLHLLTSGAHEVLRKATRVVHTPLFIPFDDPPDVPRIRESNILFVGAAGNVSIFNGDRDMYNINHVIWAGERGRERYNSILEVYNTGKAIIATVADPSESGKTEEIEPDKYTVSCGDLKESCFTILPGQSASDASAQLAVMSFYLAQFWETPEEIVEVLKQCSVDIGEPGVDREFGNGMVSLLCPPVLKKEVEVVSQYLEGVGEKGEMLQGGEITGTWSAENTILEVYIPRSLQEVLQAEVRGEVTGTVDFKGNRMIADFTVEALIQTEFLLKKVIEAKAEDTLQFEKAYTVDQEKIVVGEQSFSYTATEDSLHVVRTFSLNEVLALLPEPLGSMVDMASPDFFVDDPIQLRMSFSKEKPSLPGDFDGDGIVNTSDFLIFVAAFGASRGEAAFDEELDLVPDGIIGIADFLAFIDQFGKTSNS